jgi:hypothetical protein
LAGREAVLQLPDYLEASLDHYLDASLDYLDASLGSLTDRVFKGAEYTYAKIPPDAGPDAKSFLSIVMFSNPVLEKVSYLAKTLFLSNFGESGFRGDVVQGQTWGVNGRL